MAQPSTIDRKSLTRSADMFSESMVAFLDTEMEYIQYLRERNGGGEGVGGFGGQRGSVTQLDHSRERKYEDGSGMPRIPRLRRPKNLRPKRVKPRNKPRIGDKLRKFKNLRNSRNITKSLTKLGLRGNQIDFYKNLRAQDVPMEQALKQARRFKPGGNFISRSINAATNMIPNRPEFLTRMNMGGNLKHAGNNFFTRGLRPGNITETASAIKQSAVKNVNNLVEGAKTTIGDTATNITKNITKQLPLESVMAKSTIEFSKSTIKNVSKSGVGTGLKAAKKLISPIVKRIPIIGALIDFALNFFVFKESPGRALFKTAGGLIGAWGLGALGSVIPGFGNLVGMFIGGAAGDWLGGKLYDAVFAGKDPNSDDLSIEERKQQRIDRQGYEDDPFDDSGLITYKEGGVGYGAGGSVITAPTRGMFGGSRALVGEANEAEIILPMSKIGDALSAVYREGASVMVGATLAFLGPLSGGNPAAAKLLSDARRIAQITGADTDVKVNKVELPDLSGTPNTTNTTSSSTESTSDVTKMTTGGQDNSQINMTTSLKGTERWKTILPQGDPLFSSPFGPRWGRMHRGIDIGVWEDSPVHAQEDGVVEQILPKFGEYGGAVVVSHQDGTANLYGHVYDYVVEKGQKVMKGDQLAKIQYYPGKDGSNQSHLHFERFNKSGTRIDPLPYFSQGGSNIPVKKETKMDSVNKGGPNLRDISSNFVNVGSQTKRNNQTLIDTPVNVSKTVSTSSPQMIPVPEPYPVPVIKKEYVPVEETEKTQRMVIDVFGKGASRT